MQFNVAQLMKEPIGGLRRYDLAEDLSALAPQLKAVSPLAGKLQLIRTNSGVLALGELAVEIEVGCQRCLEPVVISVQFQLEESFRPLTDVYSGRYIPLQEYEGAEADLYDEALLIDEQHILDITEVVRQSIWLALPMYPRCGYETASACPIYRLRIQEMQTGLQEQRDAPRQGVSEQDEAIDPRWKALLALHPHDEAEESSARESSEEL